MAIAETGHINPMLPLVAQLKERGCHVSFFVSESMRGVVEAAGAKWYTFRTQDGQAIGGLDPLTEGEVEQFVPDGTPEADYNSLVHSGVCRAVTTLQPLLDDLVNMQPPPDVIVYDTFLPSPLVAAHYLNIPAIGLVTYPGPGTEVSNSEASAALESLPWISRPHALITEKYGYDLFQQGLLLSFVSPLLNLVTTIDEFYSPPASVQVRRFGDFPFRCIGSVVNKHVPRVQNAHAREHQSPEQLVESVEHALKAGKRLIYVAMGTVSTSKHFWNTAFGHFAEGNDEVGEGESRSLCSYTGKEFCEFVFRTCLDSVRDFEDVLVVMCVGPQPDVLSNFSINAGNVILCQTAPQLELLEHASVFVTHGGANSMHEALSLAVPLIVVPIFGDQPSNADAVARSGAGYSFRHPLRTLNRQSLNASLKNILDPRETNEYRIATADLARKIRNAGGVGAATDAILAEVRDPKIDVTSSFLDQTRAACVGGA